jgi:hypothetical protein
LKKKDYSGLDVAILALVSETPRSKDALLAEDGLRRLALHVYRPRDHESSSPQLQPAANLLHEAQSMTRHCDICGTPIGSEAGACPSCGSSHLSEGQHDNTVYGKPRWGVMTIALRVQSPARAAALLKTVRETWADLEANSFQKLAPSQLHLVREGAASPVRLIGPYTSYVRIQSDFGDALQLEFEDASLAEVEDMLRGLPRASS